MKYPMKMIQYRWGDLDTYYERECPHENLWIGILERAWHDLTFQGQLGENEMRFLQEAYEFITTDSPVFAICCQVMGFAESHIRTIRKMATELFQANYKAPTPKIWSRRGRKPRGYVESPLREL